MSRNANTPIVDRGAAAKLFRWHLLGSKCRISSADRTETQDHNCPARAVATLPIKREAAP
jgi:hypothetical protein